MNQETITVLVFLVFAIGVIILGGFSVYLLSFWDQDNYTPVEGYAQVETLTGSGTMMVKVLDYENFEDFSKRFPTLESIKVYIETGYHKRICWGDNFFHNVHVWVGICRGEITEVNPDQKNLWNGYPTEYIKSYLKEVYDYNNLGEK